MRNINSSTTLLLDKLYNLRGSDSVIFANIEKESASAMEVKTSSEKKKQDLEKTIEKLSADKDVLESQGERLKNVLKSLSQEDFSVIVERLHIDFNPEQISEKINEKLPSTITQVADEKKEAERKLVDVENEITSSTTKLEELAIRKDEAVQNQNKLNEFFELALSGNSNLTRDSITSLLEKFKFTKDEQRECAKLLMFPEDGLFDYEANVENGETSRKSISDIFQEAKEIENVTEKEEPEYEHTQILNEGDVLVNQTEEKEDNNNDELTEEVKNLLKVCGFNVNDFTDQDINKIKENYDNELIANNVDYLDKLGITKDIFIGNVDLFTDKELKTKVDTIIAAGKTSFDVYLNPNVLIKYNLEQLNAAIDALKDSGLDPAKVPLMAF